MSFFVLKCLEIVFVLEGCISKYPLAFTCLLLRSGQIDAKELQRALVNGNWSNFSEEACRMMIGNSGYFVMDSYT